jgi:urea-proton symporter
MSSTGTLQVLSPATGYGLIVGLGVAFSAIMVVLTLIQNRYTSHSTFKSSEEFNAASRSIKPGTPSSISSVLCVQSGGVG